MQLLAVTAILCLFAGGATLAHAEGEPPPTTPEPSSTSPTTTIAPPPAPQGAFGWELAGKPPSRRTRPVAPSPSAGTWTSPATPVVTTTSKAIPSPRPGRHVGLEHSRKRPSPVPHVVRSRRTGAVLGAPTNGASRDSYGFVLTVGALSVAIACFALGSVPSARVRWRRGAVFVAFRRTEVTVVGFVCLLAAAVVYVLAGNR